MSVHYSPFHSFNVTSKSSAVNRLIHLTDLTPEDQSILAGSNDTKPGSIEEKDLLDPHPEEDQDAVVIKENTNYSPDRGFINTPAGNSSGDDVTPSVDELEKDSSRGGLVLPSLWEEEDYTVLTNKYTQEVPSAVIDYTNESTNKTPQMVLKGFDGSYYSILAKDLFDEHTKIVPEIFEQEKLETLATVKELVDYFYKVITPYSIVDSRGYQRNTIFGAYLYRLAYDHKSGKLSDDELRDFFGEDFSPKNMKQYIQDCITRLNEIESAVCGILIANMKLIHLSMDSVNNELSNPNSRKELIKQAKKYIDENPKEFINTEKDGTVTFTYDDLGLNGKVIISKEMYNNKTFKSNMKPSRFLVRLGIYKYIIVAHGRTLNKENGKYQWDIEQVTVDGKQFTDLDKLIHHLKTTDNNVRILVISCNEDHVFPDSTLYDHVDYADNKVLFESADLAISTKGSSIDILNRLIDFIPKKIKYLNKLKASILSQIDSLDIAVAPESFEYIYIFDVNKLTIGMKKIHVDYDIKRYRGSFGKAIKNNFKFYTMFLMRVMTSAKRMLSNMTVHLNEGSYNIVEIRRKHMFSDFVIGDLDYEPYRYMQTFRGCKYNTIDECIGDIALYVSAGGTLMNIQLKNEAYENITDEEDEHYNHLLESYIDEAAIPGSETHEMVKTALGISDQESRTREDVIRDHIAYNAQFFNAIYYGANYAKSITTMGGLDFLEYFYPDMGTHSFFVYVHSAIGKLALHADLYKKLGMRIPLISEPSDPIGWKDLSERDQGVLEDLILQYYDAQENWFNTDISDDMDHLIYCVRLYAILDKIMRDPNFNMDDLKPEHLNILGQWERRVQEWYNHFQETEEYTEPWYQAIQHLHDLCWNFTDNPDSPDVHAENIVNMTCAMAGGTDPAKGDHTLITKADCDKYLIQQLGFDDSIYLIPEKMEYPVLNKHSLKLAMDSIPRVAKEYPDDLNTFVKNANRKYKELGCTFSITADHPFAQYADPAIVDNMFSVLSEGDTAVNDTDGAANIGSPNNKTDQPWYKRLDYTGTLYRDGSENKEMGPNTKPMQKPDWTQHYSIL